MFFGCTGRGDDEKIQQIILKFIRDYAGAQHSLEWAKFIGSAAFDIVLTALLAVATGGAGAVASVGSKAGRLMKPLAKLGEKFSELAKKLSKKFKPKKRKKTKVGGGENKGEVNNKGGGKKKPDKGESGDGDDKSKAPDVDAPIDYDGHIFNGEVKPNGKVVGGHSTATGEVRVIPGTKSAPNAQGVYKAKIEVPDPNNPGNMCRKLIMVVIQQCFHIHGILIKSKMK